MFVACSIKTAVAHVDTRPAQCQPDSLGGNLATLDPKGFVYVRPVSGLRNYSCLAGWHLK